MAASLDRRQWRRMLFFVLLMQGAWWILAENRGEWWWGAPAALVLGILSGRPAYRAGQFCFGEFLKFLPFFLWHSFLGGADVARRVLDPRLPIAPRLFVYPLFLPEGPGRVFLINVVSLQPGTLSADLRGDDLYVHSLDEEGEVLKKLPVMERRISAIFPAKEPARPARTGAGKDQPG